MVEDIRDTRSEKDDDDKKEEEPKLSLKSLISGVINSRKYNDTSMYHAFPSSLRPPIIAVVVSQLIFQLHARRDGGKEMMAVLSTQHCMRMLHDDAMKVRRPGGIAVPLMCPTWYCHSKRGLTPALG